MYLSMVKVGFKARFFHPMTLGVMHMGVVKEVYKDGTLSVRFDVEFDGEHTFRTCSEYNVPAKANTIP